MTSVIPFIQTALRMVAGDILSTAARYRILLTGSVAEPRLYNNWQAISGVLTQETERQEYNPDRGRYETVKITQFRTADNVAKLEKGSQIMLPSGTMYAVIAIDSSGPGSIHYGLERIEGSIVAGGDRGAPV